LLEALPAEDRAALRRPEGNCRFFSALGAGRLRLRSHLPAAPTAAFRSFGLATFTTFGFVFESFVREEHLFPGGKYELGTALRALQHLVMEFHLPLPPCPCLDPGDAHSLLDRRLKSGQL